MQTIDSDDTRSRVAGCPLLDADVMPISDFPELLGQHMRRIRASASGVASEIGISREAVNNWRQGHSLPNRKHRDKVLGCANYLRLTEVETNQLLVSAGFEAEFPVEAARRPVVASTGNAGAPAAVTAVLDRLQQLRPYPVALLLTQAHWGQPPERSAMLEAARSRYGAARVLHLQPPFSAEHDPESYFAALAAQCGFTGIGTDHAFEAELARLLQQPGPLFCLVSRFEQGAPTQRDLLAGILRSLSEMFSGQLHVLICGGPALADLKYQGGDLSLLNIAATESWPELTSLDIQRMALPAVVGAVIAERALRLSGGHPLLASAALLLLNETPDAPDAALIDQLASHPPLWQAFLPLLEHAAHRPSMLGWLAQTRLAPARPYLLDPLLRSLYWHNLLVARRHDDGLWLEWRCQAIREAGLLIAHSLGDASA